MMGWDGNGIGMLEWLGMGAVWFILIGLIVWLVVRLLPGSSGGTTRTTGATAIEGLDRRLDCGEIDLPTWQDQRVALLDTQSERTRRP